jgi:hypothetical protein
MASPFLVYVLRQQGAEGRGLARADVAFEKDVGFHGQGCCLSV